MFKVGDKVYHIKFGWGIVISYTHSLIKVDFITTVQYSEIDDKLLSFTEYTLQGFTQERPIELPKVGELCLVKEDESNIWLVREFAEYRDGFFICKEVFYQGEGKWKQMKRIKILD